MLFRSKKLPWSITGSLGTPFEAKPAKLWVLRSAAPISYLLRVQGYMEAPFKKDARKLTQIGDGDGQESRLSYQVSQGQR